MERGFLTCGNPVIKPSSLSVLFSVMPKVGEVAFVTELQLQFQAGPRLKVRQNGEGRGERQKTYGNVVQNNEAGCRGRVPNSGR